MIDGIDSVNHNQYPSSPSLIYITTLVNNHRMKIMLDTGASYSFINADFLRFPDHFSCFKKHRKRFFLADGLTSLQVIGTIQLNIKLGDVRTTTQAFIAKHLCASLILGMNYLSKYDFEIHTKKRNILFQVNDQRIIIPMDHETKTNEYPMNSTNTSSSSSTSNRQHPIHLKMSPLISTFYPSSQCDTPVHAGSPSNRSQVPDESTSTFEETLPDQVPNRTTTGATHSFNTTQQQLRNLLKHINDINQRDLLQSHTTCHKMLSE